MRAAQMAAFGAVARESRLERLCDHLARHFPQVVGGLDRSTLRRRVGEALERAAFHGLVSAQDGCRYLNLEAALGWGFEATPENGWIREVLADESAGAPSDRLRLVVDGVLQRAEVEAHNRALRRSVVGPEPRPSASDLLRRHRDLLANKAPLEPEPDVGE